MNSPHNLQTLLQYCQNFRSRLTRLLALVGAARWVCLAILLFVVLSLVDWRMHWNGWIRLATLVAFVAVLVHAAVKTWRALKTSRWNDRDVLHFLGLASPTTSLDWLVMYELLTVREQIQELQSANGEKMADAALQRLATEIQPPAWERVFDTTSVRRWLGTAVSVVGIFGLLAVVVIPDYAKIGATRLFVPFSTTRWPHRTTIDVAQPEHGWTVPQLESFPIRATVTGEVPARVTLAYKTSASSAWVREKLPVRDDGSVVYTFPEVREPVRFYLEGGDFQTDGQQIEIVQRPFLKTISAHYSYPAYARLPDRTMTGGQLAGLEGTKVRLQLESSMPLDRAVLVFAPEVRSIVGRFSKQALENASQSTSSAEKTKRNADTQEREAKGAAGSSGVDWENQSMGGNRKSGEDASRRIELTKKSATLFSHELMLTTSGQYAVELYEPNGYREAKPEIYEIRVTPDDPPEVELLSPGKDLVETNQASIEVSLKARDQLGLNKVEVFYQLGDQPPQALSDVITGPIPQSGPESAARFTWELRKQQLPDAGTLHCFVRVRDNNPTGRGQRDSLKRQIKLVRPSEFHLEAIEQAKLLEEEARIAWKNQLQAWEIATKWKDEAGRSPNASYQENEPQWAEMHDAQQRAFQAAKQVRVHLQTLTEKYERNHMGQDFMAGRLSVVAELLVRLQDKEHAPIATSLQDARPKTSADAAPERLKTLRATALGQTLDHQKFAVLILERMLRKLYDWRDLQSATITTKLLHEQQDEVLIRTEQVAPKTIAKEIEDLSDQDQDRLLTLGKQQRAIFDTETGLEQQLTYMMYKAEKQARKSILDPLRAAFTNLRNNRVNDHLKQSADLIANNQPSQIINRQKSALRALNVVLAGLVAAGQKVDEEQPLSLAMNPTRADQFDPDQIKPQEVASKDSEKPNEITPAEPPTTTELPTLPEGSDALSAAVRLAIELEDNVLARTRYLDKNRSDTEMPRFVGLKLLRLQERQADALEALQRAQAAPTRRPVFQTGLQNSEKPKADAHDSKSEAANTNATSASSAVATLLGLVRDEFQQSVELLKAADVAPAAQQIQADAIETLRGVLQDIALVKAVEDATAENRRLNGVDGFNRPYLLRGKDLETASEIVEQLHDARQRQAHALRLVERFAQHPVIGKDAGKKVQELEKLNRRRAAESQRSVAETFSQITMRVAQLSAEVPDRVRVAATGSWSSLMPSDLAKAIDAGNGDAQLAPSLRDAVQQIDAALLALRELLEERVRPEPTVIAKAEDSPKLTLEEYQRLTSPQQLAELLKAENSLPPELRERMARSLEQDLPPKFRELLTAYYASFIKQQAKEREESK